MSRDFDGAHEMLKWWPVCSHICQIARFFLSLYRRSNNYIFKFCEKFCIPELCRVSTVQFMTAVPFEGIGIFKVPLAMMHTRDGATSGLERSRKPGKWTRILKDRSMMTRSTRARSISIPRILKYVSIALLILPQLLIPSQHLHTFLKP